MKTYSLTNAVCYEVCRLLVSQKPFLKTNWVVARVMSYCFKDWVEWKAEMTMTSVDDQVSKLKQIWKEQENQSIVDRIQEQNPDCKVSLHDANTGAVLIQHPLSGSNAQQLLGGAVEIKSPWL